MIEFCCLSILLVIIIFILLTMIPKRITYKNYQHTQNNYMKSDGKICIKCGNISHVDAKFCNHCGNEF